MADQTRAIGQPRVLVDVAFVLMAEEPPFQGTFTAGLQFRKLITQRLAGLMFRKIGRKGW